MVAFAGKLGRKSRMERASEQVKQVKERRVRASDGMAGELAEGRESHKQQDPGRNHSGSHISY